MISFNFQCMKSCLSLMLGSVKVAILSWKREQLLELMRYEKRSFKWLYTCMRVVFKCHWTELKKSLSKSEHLFWSFRKWNYVKPPQKAVNLRIHDQITRNLNINWSVMSSNPIKSSHCFLDQETLLSLLNTGWFQERIWELFHNQTQINGGHYGRKKFKSNELTR